MESLHLYHIFKQANLDAVFTLSGTFDFLNQRIGKQRYMLAETQA